QHWSVHTDRDVLAGVMAEFEESAGLSLGISREELDAEPDMEAAYAKALAALQTSGVFFSPGAAVAELKALVAVYRSAMDASAGYLVEGPVGTPIHLLMASDRDLTEGFMDQRPAWGWAEWTNQCVVVDEVPGTHITMMAPPHVAVLAERLGGILAAADA
ncbi:MAG: hypothetical protein ACK6BG_06680, partial [Cyanobacteriota bacterium]